MKQKEILGAILPPPEDIANCILDERSKGFTKFMKINCLKPGHKIIFYVPRGINGIIGKATIESTKFLKSINVLKKYHTDLFLTPKGV